MLSNGSFSLEASRWRLCIGRFIVFTVLVGGECSACVRSPCDHTPYHTVYHSDCSSFGQTTGGKVPDDAIRIVTRNL